MNHSPLWNTGSFGSKWFLSWYRGIDCWPFSSRRLVYRIRFNDSWFIFHKSWLFLEFLVKKTQDYGLEACQQVQNYSAIIILKTFLSTVSFINKLFIEQKFCKHHFFFGAESNKMIRWENWQFKYLLVLWFTVVSIKTFRIIMQHKEIWFIILLGLCKPRWRWQY